MPFQIQTTVEQKNTCVIHLIGEFDADNLSALEDTIESIVDKKEIKKIILNGDGLLFIDSKVVGCIAHLYTTLLRSNRILLVAHLNETINDIFTLVGLNNIIKQFKTLDAALKYTQ